MEDGDTAAEWRTDDRIMYACILHTLLAFENRANNDDNITTAAEMAAAVVASAIARASSKGCWQQSRLHRTHSNAAKDLFGDKRDTRQQTDWQSIIKKEKKSFQNLKFRRATIVCVCVCVCVWIGLDSGGSVKIRVLR